MTSTVKGGDPRGPRVAVHWDRSLHGKITGLCYGVLAHLEELKRLLKEEA